MSATHGPALHEFLAEDFARIDPSLLTRCMRLDGRRLYVSGATGFFGKNLLSLFAYLESRGATFEVTALSRSPDRFLRDHRWCGNLTWLDWRAGDAVDAWQGAGRYDYMIHAATDTSTAAHLNKIRLFDGIVAATRQGLAFAASHGVRRVLLCGSGAQYGAIPADLSAGVTESSQLACDSVRASSAYAEGKRVSELLAAVHGQEHGFEVVNTRSFAFVGPGLKLDGHFAIGNFIRNALDGQTLRLTTAGEALRSYLYGADLAVWLLVLLLEADNGCAVNIGSDQAIKIIDLARRVCDVVNPLLDVAPGPAVAGAERQHYLPSIGAAKALGLDVWTDLNRAIARTAQWHGGIVSADSG